MSQQQKALDNLRIGIDVGGTNTDAVALDDTDRIVAWTKSATTRDVATGIESALDAVLGQLESTDYRIRQVLLGSTHGINAILQRRNLCKVATIRLGAPATTSVPPLISWPPDLRKAVSAGEAVLPGGNYVDGRSITDVSPSKVRAFLESCGENVEAVAVTGVFSPAYREQELQVAELVYEILGPGFPVSLSHEVGSLGLLQRENATVLNAALLGVAAETSNALQRALKSRGIQAPVFFAQNDGSLMGGDLASRYPIMTIGSGPANSIRGAAYLSGWADAIVADVGGTTTDLGVLVGGFPREAADGNELGGVRTNSRMPDLLSLSIGGGTIVNGTEDNVEVGPVSVGHELTTKGWSFGGQTLTLSDAAVSEGRVELGHRKPGPALKSVLAKALEIADERLADAIETMNLGQALTTMVVVGGGSFLIRDEYPGISKMICPDYAGVANAVGVAVAPVSARWDTIITGDRRRQQAIDEACDMAISRAVQAGADPSRVEVVEMVEVPLNYLSPPGSRLRVRAAGPLGVLS